MDLTAHLPLITFGILVFFVIFIPTMVIILWRSQQAKSQAHSQAAEQAQNSIQKLSTELTIAQQNLQHAEQDTRELNERNQQLANALEQVKLNEQQLKGELQRKQQELQLTLESERQQTALQLKQAQEKIELLQEARESLTKEFKELASNVLEQKANNWREDSKQSMEGVLNPLKEQLKDFRSKVEDVYDKESKERVSLLHEITHLKQLNEKMSQDAINLTKALKGESKTQGNWGEVVLERVLESSGLTKGREYFTQVKLKSDTGERFMPDVVVKLPDGKDIIIDAKVSLTDYERYTSSEDELAREASLKAHIGSIRSHIKALGSKSYENLEGVNSPDFVFIFIPIEPAYMLAAEQDPNLFPDAIAQKIVLVSPTTLLASLRVIENIWRVERQHRNAEEIAKNAGNLYDKLVGFIDSLEDVGNRIQQAEKAYSKAHSQLYSGHGNLVSRAEKLRKLGASPKKQINEVLVDKAVEDEQQQLEDDSQAD
jgi:DNA recombination protein RmuC